MQVQRDTNTTAIPILKKCLTRNMSRNFYEIQHTNMTFPRIGVAARSFQRKAEAETSGQWSGVVGEAEKDSNPWLDQI